MAATRNWWRALGKVTKRGERRGTARRRWLGTYASERPRVRVSARARFDQEEQGLDSVLVCAGKMSAAQPWRWHNADNMCMTRVCAHTTPGQRKARPWLDGGMLGLWVPAANRSSATHAEQRNDTTARQRSARGDDGSGTCKATGSARWPALKRRRVCAAARCGTAGITQAVSSQGSVQPRLEGRVQNKVKGKLTSRFWTRRRGGAVEQRKKTGAQLAAGEAEQHDIVSSRSGSYSAVAT
jgi:hypothetical protein